MRTLKFHVEGQTVKFDPLCDFDGLVPGTESYVRAEFDFSRDWRPYTKFVSFRSALGKEYETIRLRDGKSCMIPTEALKKRSFKIQVFGTQGELKMTTNKLTVNQNGGKA